MPIEFPFWSMFFEITWFLSPGFNILTKSGTTHNIPVKMHVSPGWAVSHKSFLKITSNDLGIPPSGSSEGSSWTLIFWKSENWENAGKSYHLLATQLTPLHFLGYVYLNCCSTGALGKLQLIHLKTPLSNSGLTSVVLVTVPLNAVSCPNFWHFKLLN